jgi:hypothetical protein
MLFWVLAAYGCMCIISWSAIFEDLREWVKTKSSFFYKLYSFLSENFCDEHDDSDIS